LRSRFSMVEMFKFAAELGGVKNLTRFELQVQPQAELAAQAQAGNMVPVGGPTGRVNALPADPASRLIGGS